MAGSTSSEQPIPLWLLAELTYACPLQCPYCSNPVDFALQKGELTTDEWLKVFREARALGSTQLGLSGGEPLVRKDLEILVAEASKLGFYTNLITSGVGMDEQRIKKLKQAGLDHIQISFQASSKDVNDHLAGTAAFEHKLAMAKLVKQYEFPLVFNIVLHRGNIDHIAEIIDLALALDADYIELANTQYYGFALHNRDVLLPRKEQVVRAEEVAHAYQAKYKNKKIYYVVPDYFENRPKPCMEGWASMFVTVCADGTVLPCHAARVIPDLEFPNIKQHSLTWIWKDSPLFNKFRGFDWMKEPCRSCPEKVKDFGGCRCQAFLLTGDAAMADPVCDLSPDHHLIEEAIQKAEKSTSTDLVFRNPRNSKLISIPVRVENKKK